MSFLYEPYKGLCDTHLIYIANRIVICGLLSYVLVGINSTRIYHCGLPYTNKIMLIPAQDYQTGPGRAQLI